MITSIASFTASGSAASMSTPKGLSVRRAHARASRSRMRSGWRAAHAERAEAAGFGDGGDQLGERHLAHAGEEHRMLDVEEVADRGAQRHAARTASADGSLISFFTSLPLS